MKSLILIPAALVAFQAQAVAPAIKSVTYQHEVLTLAFAEAPDWSAGLVARIGHLEPGAKPTGAYPGCTLSLAQVATSAKDRAICHIQARQLPDYLELTQHNATTYLTRLYRLKTGGRKVLFEEVGKP